MACEKIQFDDDNHDTLLNVVIIEVLSASTEAYDRCSKFAHCRRLDSLHDYVFVSQHQIRVEYFKRQANLQWLLTEFTVQNEALVLESIACNLALEEICEKVAFPLQSV